MVGCGAALWVHPVAAAFIGGLAITAALRSRRWRERGWAGLVDLILGRHVSGVTRVLIVTAHVIVACEFAAFVWTYLGFRVNVGLATAAHPQKVFRMLAIASALTVIVHALVGDVARGRALRALGSLPSGWCPCSCTLLVAVRPGRSSPNPITDAPALFKVFLLEAAPMMLGVRAADVGLLVSWWTTVPPSSCSQPTPWRPRPNGSRGSSAPARGCAGPTWRAACCSCSARRRIQRHPSYRYVMPLAD
jgi:hypothetical protein